MYQRIKAELLRRCEFLEIYHSMKKEGFTA